MYLNGRGVPQDYAEAVKWFRFADKGGHTDAQVHLGRMYMNGQGVAQDDVEAARWYRKAALQGNFYGQLNLGWMYANGHGVAQDYVLAYMWYDIAVANGYERNAKAERIATSKMSKQEIAKAKQLAVQCLDSGYQDCGG